MKYCTHCGASLRRDAAFCVACGTAVRQPPSVVVSSASSKVSGPGKPAAFERTGGSTGVTSVVGGVAKSQGVERGKLEETHCIHCGAVVGSRERICRKCNKLSADSGAAFKNTGNKADGHERSALQKERTGIVSRMRTKLRLPLRLLPALQKEDWRMIAGGIAGGSVWHVFSRFDSSAPLGRDWLTPAVLAALPVALIVFRKPLDALLEPLQKAKALIPRRFVWLLGIMLPFVLAFFFRRSYFGGDTTGQEYEFARKTTVWSTLLTYLLFRLPGGSSIISGKCYGPAGFDI